MPTTMIPCESAAKVCAMLFWCQAYAGCVLCNIQADCVQVAMLRCSAAFALFVSGTKPLTSCVCVQLATALHWPEPSGVVVTFETQQARSLLE